MPKLFQEVVLCALLHVSISSAAMPSRAAYPQVISHRGASGYVPEHTLHAYRLAMDLGTDYIEPDLCLTQDGVFVAMHDVTLDETTNVAQLPQFDDKKTTKVVDGENKTAYFVSDFTFEEIQQLRVKQRLESKGRTDLYDYLLSIPDLDSIMKLTQDYYAKHNRTVGIYLELKMPDYHRELGFDMSSMVLQQLQQGGFIVSGDDTPNNVQQEVVPVVIECFEPTTLMALAAQSALPLVQLVPIEKDWKYIEEVLTTVSQYAAGVGPDKSQLGDVPFETGRELVSKIHAAGLVVHPYTFQADTGILDKFAGDFAAQELYFYCCLRVDGVFTEFPDQTRETVDQMLLMQQQSQSQSQAGNATTARVARSGRSGGGSGDGDDDFDDDGCQLMDCAAFDV